MNIKEILESPFWDFLCKYEKEQKKKSRSVSFNEIATVTKGECRELKKNIKHIPTKEVEGTSKEYLKRIPRKPWLTFQDICSLSNPSEIQILLAFRRCLRIVIFKEKTLSDNIQKFFLFAFDKSIYEYVHYKETGKALDSENQDFFDKYINLTRDHEEENSHLIKQLFYYFVDKYAEKEEDISQCIITLVKEQNLLDFVFNDEGFKNVLEALDRRALLDSLQCCQQLE